MSTHKHSISREKFLAEMQRRGWKMDGNGWIVPEGRRQHDKEADWYQSILVAIECECAEEIIKLNERYHSSGLTLPEAYQRVIDIAKESHVQKPASS